MYITMTVVPVCRVDNGINLQLVFQLSATISSSLDHATLSSFDDLAGYVRQGTRVPDAVSLFDLSLFHGDQLAFVLDQPLKKFFAREIRDFNLCHLYE